jgi:TolB-like protein
MIKPSTIFSTEEVDQQIRKILDFPMFRKSPVLSRFLEFVVDETVHKRELQIKEYSIAINVLHRGHNFNPNADSIVRIHAGRLRRALNDYYLTNGMYDPITIEIPKGCYVPEFYQSGTSRPPDKRVPVLSRPGYSPLIAIFPFRVVIRREDINEALVVLKEQLSMELLSFPNISLIAYYSDEIKAKIKENILEAGKTVGADYIITGSLTCIAGHVRLIVNLLVTATGEVLLCKSFDNDIVPNEVFEINDDVLQNLAGFSGDCYGVISREWQKHVA